MLRRNKSHIILTTLIAALPILVGFLLWDRLPEEIATHFNFQGEPDGWSSKFFTVVCLPMILVGVHVICVLGTLADPKNANIHDKIFRMVLWITPCISLLVMGGVYGYALGYNVDIARVTMILMGVVFILLGNYMPKCRQNYTVGIKVPWTLADPENWNKTHRFAGWLWTGAGIVFLGMTLLGWMHFAVMFGLIMIVGFLPMGYSYWLYVKKEKESK